MKHLKPAVNAIAVVSIVLSLTHFASAQDRAETLSRHDKLKIAAQAICPVSGEKLGSMGTPLKAKIGEEELFLCCKGCTSKQVSREHWATIHANFAKAQGQCPVMENKLPGNAKWAVVDGQIFYVCCPGCLNKIKADPKTYFTKLDNLYSASLASSSTTTAGQTAPSRDALRIAAQKICPVSGKALGSMGSPLKVKIGEEHVFLCCKGCTGKQVSRNHWATIHSNFAKAQGQCPVMEKDLPPNPKWTVVNGRIVYVCCPPCTKKIQADPETFLTKVDALYSKSLKGARTKIAGSRTAQ
jgi:YHS domain-containing protein